MRITLVWEEDIQPATQLILSICHRVGTAYPLVLVPYAAPRTEPES